MEEGAGEDVEEEVEGQRSMRWRRLGVWAVIVAAFDDGRGGGHAMIEKGGKSKRSCDWPTFLRRQPHALSLPHLLYNITF